MNISIVKDIALRMKDPSHVQKQLSSSMQMNSTDHLSVWASLSHGYPGILLLFSTLDQLYEEEEWDRISHQYVLEIKKYLKRVLLSTVLFLEDSLGHVLLFNTLQKESRAIKNFFLV